MYLMNYLKSLLQDRRGNSVSAPDNMKENITVKYYRNNHQKMFFFSITVHHYFESFDIKVPVNVCIFRKVAFCRFTKNAQVIIRHDKENIKLEEHLWRAASDTI